MSLFGAEVVVPWWATTTAKAAAATAAVVTGFIAIRHFDREAIIDDTDRIINKRKQFYEEEKISQQKVAKAYKGYVISQYEHERLVREHRKSIATEKSRIRKELDAIEYGIIFRKNHWKIPEIQHA